MKSVAQGNSITRNVTDRAVPDFTGYTGTWAISVTIDGPVLESGPLTVSADTTYMICVVPPYDPPDELPLGTVFLECQVNNTALSYRRTLLQETILIIAKIIPGDGAPITFDGGTF
jgi:hypothetical protein